MGQEEKIREFWQFAIDVAWDQHRRHPELSRGKCLKERSFLHTLLNGSDSDVFAEACQMADSVEDKSAMEVLFPRIFDTAVAGENRRAADIGKTTGVISIFTTADSRSHFLLIRNMWLKISVISWILPGKKIIVTRFLPSHG